MVDLRLVNDDHLMQNDIITGGSSDNPGLVDLYFILFSNVIKVLGMH